MKHVPHALAAVALALSAAAAWSQESPSDQSPTNQETAEIDAESRNELAEVAGLLGDETSDSPEQSRSTTVQRQDLIASLTIFVLAVFVGFEVITKVPPTLHTPLMSGSNAISGITLVGAVIVASGTNFSSFVGMLAVMMATINAVGGFLVTHRMLAMFRRK